jgi:methionyl aminopeptidase
VGQVSQRARALLFSTRAALSDAMAEVRAGAPLRNIGRAVERRAKRSGFRVVKNLCGHGVGRHIHEEPQVPNTFERNNQVILHEGLVMTIEPFLTTSATRAIESDDGWTLRTPDGSIGAQFASETRGGFPPPSASPRVRVLDTARVSPRTRGISPVCEGMANLSPPSWP